MSINYTGSYIAVGNSAFKFPNTSPIEVWGMSFVDERYVVLLVRDVVNDVLEWRRIDSLSSTTAVYEVTAPVSVIGAAAGDHAGTQGQFLTHEDGYYYYFVSDPAFGNRVIRTNADTFAVAGSQRLRKKSGLPLDGSGVSAIVVKNGSLYAASKPDSTLYRWDISAWSWDDSVVSATSEVLVPEYGSNSLLALFSQVGATDVVSLLKGTAKQAVKYSGDLSQRVGSFSFWTDPSDNIVAAEFNASILYVAECNNLTAGTGIALYRFADASTALVSKEQTTLTVSSTLVKAGSNQVVEIKYSAKDGYGIKFTPSEKVRFSIVRVGDVFDKNDASLSTSSTGPFRNQDGSPTHTIVDIPFDADGVATCYWHTPLEVPVEEVLHRIKVRYPIY